MDTYTMTIAGLERHLPLCPLNEHMRIAAFVIFGDVEITVASATELLKKAPEFDVLITAEAKGIPLVYEMARQSGKPYYIARKYPKLYMPNAVAVEVRSITTDKQQTLYMDESEMADIRGKKVLIVDDVIPAVRQALRSKFARAKNTAQSRSAIRSQVIVELEKKVAEEIIDSYGEVTVTASEDDPTVCLVEFSFAVAHGLNQIYLMVHITV